MRERAGQTRAGQTHAGAHTCVPHRARLTIRPPIDPFARPPARPPWAARATQPRAARGPQLTYSSGMLSRARRESIATRRQKGRLREPKRARRRRTTPMAAPVPVCTLTYGHPAELLTAGPHLRKAAA